MKHIKTFEEIDFIRSFYQSEKSEFLELKDFCESNLIYLLDEQFRVDLFESENGGYTIHLIKDVNCIISCSATNDETWFSWQQISDYYISFVNRLLNEYEDYKFNTAEVYAKEKKEGRFSVPKQVRSIIKLKEILNNTIDPDLQIASITLNIVKK